MQKKGANISLKGYDDIFSTDQSRAEAQQERVQEIPLSELHPFEGHPFRVVDDEEMMKTAESVRDFGVLTPAIVRPDPDGGYEIVSGHRRHRASELAGKETMPAIVRDLDDDAAIILMVDANLQRESILPSERAFAYKMKLDAIKHQGQRTDLTSSQVGMKLQAMDIVGQEAGESRNQVHRYIRLTELIPELLDMVDTGQIKFNPAVELSYLASEEQKDFLSAMDYAQAAPSLSQAQRIKKLAQEGECTLDAMCEIMNEIKKGELDRVTFKTDSLRKYFPKSYTNKQMDNVILTKTERLMMSNRPKNPANARNKNVLIIGGSGSGKTRFWLKPNLLQMHSSYVVTDPKGSIVIECGNALLKHSYTIKIFNTINFQKSMHYNPFAYIHSEKDILKLVTTLIANTKGDGKAGDEFWTKAETLLYCALIGYIHYEAPVEEQNFSTLIEFLNAMEVREDDEEFQNPVDLMFEALEKKKPNHFAVRQYKKYKLAAGKTAKSILISCGARLAPFDIQEVRDVTAYDELQLDTLGDKKTALFLIMSDTDATFNFLISMIYTQLFNLLCEKADDVYGGRLPVHVRCLIDEMANIGQIPNLEKLVATIRSREISACLVLQAQSQLKAIYKDNADTIIGNMDSRIFLGGSEPTTLKELNQALGKETIDTYNTSNTRGNSPSYGLNYQKLGKDLASVDELAVLDGSKCILQLRGVRPFLSDKYDLTQHPKR